MAPGARHPPDLRHLDRTAAPPARAPRSTESRREATRFGRFGEIVAARWYRRAGYRVLASNWRCREGELDLVVARAGEVAFVEVKARGSDRFGRGLDAVDHRKQRRLRAAALRWLDESGAGFVEIRFDVVEVDRRGRPLVHEACF
ncbi:MAG: YraN family protein [Actinomycetota bacterium]